MGQFFSSFKRKAPDPTIEEDERACPPPHRPPPPPPPPSRPAKKKARITKDNKDPAALPPPTPPPPAAPPRRKVDISLLTDPAHDAIASWLTNADLLHMMETSRFFHKTYALRVEKVVLDNGFVRKEDCPVMLSMLRRRTGLLRLSSRVPRCIDLVIKAMDMGYFPRLRSFGFSARSFALHPEVVSAIDMLKKGTCPTLDSLELTMVSGWDEVMEALGEALQNRVKEKGCQGLRSLTIRPFSGYPQFLLSESLSCLLDSGACEGLEELDIETASGALDGWISRTKAPRLRVFKASMNGEIAEALCSPGVAPGLQCLDLGVIYDMETELLVEALERGQWPALKEINVDFRDGVDACRLMEAIRLYCPDMKILRLAGLGDKGWRTFAQALKGGACPLLEELEISRGSMELARALLEGGDACLAALRVLDLSSAGVDGAVMEVLGRAIARGALPNLEIIKLESNSGIGDFGVLHFVKAMEAGGGKLRCLRKLHMNWVNLGEKGARALFEALGRNACPRLQELELCEVMDGEVKREIVAIVKDREKIKVAFTGKDPCPGCCHGKEDLWELYL